jgi:hypothetical protein
MKHFLATGKEYDCRSIGYSLSLIEINYKLHIHWNSTFSNSVRDSCN